MNLHYKNWNKAAVTFMIFIIITCCHKAKGDIGNTYELLQQRKTYLTNFNIDSITFQKIIKLDSLIIESNKETIERIQKTERSTNNRQSILVFIFSFLGILLLIGILIIYNLNNEINTISNRGRTLTEKISEIIVSLIYTSLPSKTILLKSKSIHILIFGCLIVMVISMIGYLMK